MGRGGAVANGAVRGGGDASQPAPVTDAGDSATSGKLVCWANSGCQLACGCRRTTDP